MDQKPYQVWRDHFHQILYARGIFDFRVLLEYLATTQDGGMVGIISSRFESTVMDGTVDVSTPATLSM